MTKMFSSKNRPMHLGRYRFEHLKRGNKPINLDDIPESRATVFADKDNPHSIIHAMRNHQAMLDVIRDGVINPVKAEIPDSLEERTNHLKSFGYFANATAVACCSFNKDDFLKQPYSNPDITELAELLQSKQTKSFASGIDAIMADLKESLYKEHAPIDDHHHAIMFLYQNPRSPTKDEVGCDWIKQAESHRGGLLAAETAIVIGQYLRLLGYAATAHTVSSSDVNLQRLAVKSGLALMEDGRLSHPILGDNFGLSVVTTNLEIAHDQPLAAQKGKIAALPYDKRRFVDGMHPFEKLKRADIPTTYIDEPNVPRVPKRADMFARALFGDMGKKNQTATIGGHYVRKSAPSMAQRRALGAFTLLQDGESNPDKVQLPPEQASELIKATCYFLGVDAVGISRCPEWTWYSHDAHGKAIIPPHNQAISMVIDQGFDTMEGSSGDDWIAVAQSMRAYLRFALLGGVIAQQIRLLGYKAKAHTVMDGEVLQPPLLLLSGLGEVSRIGEVILNPYLGPRLKSGVVTTDLPLAHDKPIDFGLQKFCESCNKCARECPSGAITAGPKLMFNGYEIWKSDSQKCTTYRITNEGGAMCGRCMKTCPWNLEGIFSEKPLRWMAMNMPSTAPILAKLDDMVGRGGLNPVKKWWWDHEIAPDGGYRITQKPINKRDLQKDLLLEYKNQTLAVYPAPIAPHPYPYPFPMDREAGIKAYQNLISAKEHRERLEKGDLSALHLYPKDHQSPVIEVIISRVDDTAPESIIYEFQDASGKELPEWQAGAHLDLVIAPEYLRQYSLSGNPNDRSKYQISVLREAEGRGGSALLHRIFTLGRTVFISHPINHFPLHDNATFSLLMGGGIGITPIIAMAHELHAKGRDFILHYSARNRNDMPFLTDFEAFPWKDKIQLHISSEGSRADFQKLLAEFSTGWHLYCCGSVGYMDQVQQAALDAGADEDALHNEFFSVPEQPDYVNHPFTLKLSKSGKSLDVPVDKSAAEILNENGYHIDLKCADGICGVCSCKILSGEVEHRDYVLSKKQQQSQIILCQSRAKNEDGIIELDL